MNTWRAQRGGWARRACVHTHVGSRRYEHVESTAGRVGSVGMCVHACIHIPSACMYPAPRTLHPAPCTLHRHAYTYPPHVHTHTLHMYIHIPSTCMYHVRMHACMHTGEGGFRVQQRERERLMSERLPQHQAVAQGHLGQCLRVPK